MSACEGLELSEDLGHVLDALEAAPDGLGAGFAFSVLVSAEPGDQVHCLIQCWLILGSWIPGHVGAHEQRLPRVGLEDALAGVSGRSRAPFGEPEGAPCDDHVDGQCRLDALGIAEVALLDPAA